MIKNFDIKIGYECNNNCRHCVVSDNYKFGNVCDYQITAQEIIDKLKITKAKYITITGGEPTIRKDLGNILKQIKKEIPKVFISLQTNGRMFHEKEVINKLVPYIDDYLIALHSFDNTVHDYITQRKNSWNETVEGISNLISCGKLENITTQTVVSKINLETLSKTYDFFAEIGIHHCNFTYPHIMGNCIVNKNDIMVKLSELEPHLNYILDTYAQMINTESIPLCYLYRFKFAVDIYKLINLKGKKKKEYNIGIDKSRDLTDKNNKYVNTEKEIFDYQSMYEEYSQAPICDECDLKNECLGVWPEYIEHYKDELDLKPIKK